jgi:hypothetical protein
MGQFYSVAQILFRILLRKKNNIERRIDYRLRTTYRFPYRHLKSSDTPSHYTIAMLSTAIAYTTE